MKKSILILFYLFISAFASAQKFSSEKGQVTFFSDGAIEDIQAVNSQVGSLFNASNGEIVFILKVRDFQFPKPLMREHFNEKYMETEKFDKSTFQGKLLDYKTNISGVQKVKAVGKLTIHGVTHDIDVPGSIEFTNGKVILNSDFKIRLDDYSIKIPTIVWQNIAEEVAVKVEFTYKSI